MRLLDHRIPMWREPKYVKRFQGQYKFGMHEPLTVEACAAVCEKWNLTEESFHVLVRLVGIMVSEVPADVDMNEFTVSHFRDFLARQKGAWPDY